MTLAFRTLIGAFLVGVVGFACGGEGEIDSGAGGTAIRIRDDAVPPGLARETGAGVSYVSARHLDDASGEAAASPELVVLYSDPGHSRRLMVSRIDSTDAPAVLESLTSHWDDWSTASRDYRQFEAGPDGIQLAWAEADLVLWVVANGLSRPELEAFLDGVTVID